MTDYEDITRYAYHHLVCERPQIDRILIAQAMSEPLTLLTNDSTLPQYSELVRHVDSL